MDDVWGEFLGPPHGTTPSAVIANKNQRRSFKSSEHINEKEDGPYHGIIGLSSRNHGMVHPRTTEEH